MSTSLFTVTITGNSNEDAEEGSVDSTTRSSSMLAEAFYNAFRQHDDCNVPCTADLIGDLIDYVITAQFEMQMVSDTLKEKMNQLQHAINLRRAADAAYAAHDKGAGKRKSRKTA